MSTPSDWDPPSGQRVYVRSATTGDLGWLVRRGGVDKVRLDRPYQEILRDYSDGEWQQVVEHHPVPVARMVRMAFEFDRLLLKELGDHERARKQWHDLTEKQREAWLTEGPANPPIRQIMYRTILDALTEHLR